MNFDFLIELATYRLLTALFCRIVSVLFFRLDLSFYSIVKTSQISSLIKSYIQLLKSFKSSHSPTTPLVISFQLLFMTSKQSFRKGHKKGATSSLSVCVSKKFMNESVNKKDCKTSKNDLFLFNVKFIAIQQYFFCLFLFAALSSLFPFPIDRSQLHPHKLRAFDLAKHVDHFKHHKMMP